MAKKRNPKIDEAKQLYKNGMKLIDISKKLETAESTIRVWKNRYKWDSNDNETLQNKKRNVTKKNNKTKAIEKKSNIEPLDEIKELMDNEALSNKQRLFCIYYSKCFNATKAYLKAYTCTYETANAEGYKLLVKPCIKKQIDELTKIRFNKEALKAGVLQKYIDIAFADITDYVTFGQEEYVLKDKYGNVMLDENGEPETGKYSYVRPNESISVDGTIVSEVSQGKDGIKIKLADKMKALDFLNKHLNLLSDEDKIKLDIANKQLQNEKLQLENDKLKVKDKKIDSSIIIVDDI